MKQRQPLQRESSYTRLKKGLVKYVDVMGMKKPIATRSSGILLVRVLTTEALEAKEGEAVEETVEAPAGECIAMRQH